MKDGGRAQLLDGLTETRRRWKLEEEALDRTIWELDLEEAVDFSHDRIHDYHHHHSTKHSSRC